MNKVEKVQLIASVWQEASVLTLHKSQRIC